MIASAAASYGVPLNVALGIASHESQFNPTAVNSTLNSNGTVDYGLFQLNTSVLQTYGLTPAQALDPQTNINTAMSMLSTYINKYGDVDTALQAYASGPGTVASGAAPNASASGLISSVDSYQVPAGITSATSSDSSATVATDDSGDDGTDDGTILGMDPTTATLVAAIAAAALYMAS
jgi:soluble lytic murein transglycosylase-like protein